MENEEVISTAADLQAAETVTVSAVEPAAETAVPAVEPETAVAPAPAEEAVAATEAVAEVPAEEAAPARKPRQFLEVTQEMLDETAHRLSLMLDYLCLDGKVRAEKRSSKINLIIASNDAGRIIGRKGQSLESLQLLLNRMMQKVNPDYPKIYIDIDGYAPKGAGEQGGRRRSAGPREGRDGERPFRRRDNRRRDDFHADRGNSEFSDKDENLRQQALDTAKEVRRWCEPVTLPPMNSHDRRIIHITLENEADLATDSIGEGAMKSVVVKLKKQE